MFALRSGNSRALPVLLTVSLFATSAFFMLGYAQDQKHDWTVRGAKYTDDSISVKQTRDTRAVDFKPDGSMLYVLGRGSANVVAYNLGKPWTLNSGVLKNEFNLRKEVGKRGQGTVPHGLFFRKDDGAKMYVWNRTEIFEYDLMTPWDVSTAVPSGYFAFASPVKRGHDIDIKPDGTVLYIDDRGAGKVFQYNLETPWSVESAVYDHELDLTKLHRAMRGIQFSDTGERMFILDTSLKCIFEFRLSEAWMVRSATLAKTLLIDDHFKNPRGMTWRPDGKAFYVTETADSSIHTYVVP